ncbi:MAG: ATP-binding protein [Candidatus Margulisiibacteriota bacterium]
MGIFAFAFDPIRTHLQTQTDRLILPIETAEKLANEAAFGAASKSFAHEILNQMSMIQLGSPAVGHEDPAIAKKFGDMVLSCVTRLHHLSEIMLYGNKGQAEQTSITVHALFTNVAELLIAQTRMLQIEVAIDCPQTLSFKGNESEWFQVFLNLALNAIQAIKEAREADPERPTDTLQFRATQKNDTLELSIQDSGPGMSPEVQAKLFSQSFTSKATGHGLGMAFVGKVVASSGGRISVASEMGRGTGIVIKIKAL